MSIIFERFDGLKVYVNQSGGISIVQDAMYEGEQCIAFPLELAQRICDTIMSKVKEAMEAKE